MVIRNERMSVGPCRGRSIAAIAPLAPIASPAETTDLASPAHSPIADRDHVGRCWWKKAILWPSRGKAGFCCRRAHASKRDTVERAKKKGERKEKEEEKEARTKNSKNIKEERKKR